MTIFGRTEIGLSGKGAFGVGSSSTLTTNGGVDLGTAQTQGSTSGSGTLVIQSGGVWHDTGAVRLVSGVLDVAGYATTDTITGNLELGGPIGNLFSTSVSLTQATLDVTGTLAFHAAPFTSEFSTITIQNGATLNVGACNVGGGNNTITPVWRCAENGADGWQPDIGWGRRHDRCLQRCNPDDRNQSETTALH